MNVVEQFIDDESLGQLIRTDIQFLGLEQQAWEFIRGARTQRVYLDSNQLVNICDSYTYVYAADSRSVVSMERRIAFFDENGVEIHGIDISKPQNVKSIKVLNRELRQGQLDYLEAGAENLRGLAETVAEPTKSQFIQIADSIDVLFSHYEVQVDHYIQRGTMEFEEAINNESDAAILAILALPGRLPDAEFPSGLTVKESIIYQLTGVKP